MYYRPARYLTSLTILTTAIFHVFIPFESLLVNRPPCASHPDQTMALLTALWPREVKKKRPVRFLTAAPKRKYLIGPRGQDHC